MNDGILTGVLSATYNCGTGSLFLEILLCNSACIKIKGVEIKKSADGILIVTLPPCVSFSDSKSTMDIRESIISWLDKNPELDSLLNRNTGQLTNRSA